jgi:hypothetical protein
VKLSQFIVDNTETLLSEWEDFARTILPATEAMGVEQLRDGARNILLSIAAEMEITETPGEQKAKSRGRRIRLQPDAEPGRTHGADRFAQGFDLEQVASEYRALRASVVRLWAEKQGPAQPRFDELTRFNEAVDENLADALRRFSADVNHSRDLVMAVLGHDLRSPLGAIANSAHYLLRLQAADPRGGGAEEGCNPDSLKRGAHGENGFGSAGLHAHTPRGRATHLPGADAPHRCVSQIDR